VIDSPGRTICLQVVINNDLRQDPCASPRTSNRTIRGRQSSDLFDHWSTASGGVLRHASSHVWRGHTTVAARPANVLKDTRHPPSEPGEGCRTEVGAGELPRGRACGRAGTVSTIAWRPATNVRVSRSSDFLGQATKTYYRVDDDPWETVVQGQIASLASFGGIMRDGLALVAVRRCVVLGPGGGCGFRLDGAGVRRRPTAALRDPETRDTAGKTVRGMARRPAAARTAFGPMVIAAVEQ
jgi:hypothetical protein